MKKIFMATLAMLFLLSCGGDKKDSAGDKQELKFRITWATDSGRGKAISKIVEEFNKENPNIHVTLVGGSEDIQELTTMFTSQDVPDVVQLPYRYTQKFGSEGLLLESNDELKKETSNFYDSIIKLGQVNGKTYGIPWIGHAIGLVYNKDLFAKAGLDPEKAPTTWDELSSYSKIIEEKTGVKGLALVSKEGGDLNWLFAQFIYQNGGKIVNEDGTIALNSPEAIEAINFYKELLKYSAGTVGETDGKGVMQLFKEGKAAMEIQGPWGVTDIWKAGNPFKVGTAKLPKGKVGAFAEVGPHMLTIPATVDAKKMDAINKFIQFMVSKKGSEMIMLGEYDEATKASYPFRVPIRKDMADVEYFKQHPEFLPFIEGLNEPSIEVPTPAYAQVREEIAIPAFAKILQGKMTTEAAVKEIQEKGNAKIKEFGK